MNEKKENSPFRDLVASWSEFEALRSILGEPSPLALHKTVRTLDAHCRRFIALSPFLVLSTANEQGLCDASPRGDAPGFVSVLDDRHLAIPERPGNRRMDSIRNILGNPHIGLLFMIPGLGETLRINGKACIVRDPELLESMSVQGRAPMLAIGVEVEEIFVHCAKAFRRSKLWEPDSWHEHDELPAISRMLADQVKGRLEVSAEQVDGLLQESYTKRMY
ncbi:pyridoxamine 5'-phosphate oxidase family protein [Paenibacillus puerhi]|uniref:pyridoxamine 5'-phosphate oxidase family protein n=1 Tax=Paenibacillus puerhi TaxID=2692622 RepID=UPI00135C45A2|nr:pyridoxamine 5'-phosphate oxidase family protein [Paenibacillus puerhi]